MFKIELIGQLVRRTKKEEDITNKVEVVSIEKLRELAFSIAFETCCRAIDAYFIATAHELYSNH